jgi:sensor domain CHASE-containing protein
MSDVFEYPLGALIAAGVTLTVSLMTIWSVIRRERRESMRARKEAVDSLRRELKEYVNLKVERNEELKDWIQRLERRLDRQEGLEKK